MTKKDDELEKQKSADNANQWDTDSRVKQASDALIGADFPSVMIQGKENMTASSDRAIAVSARPQSPHVCVIFGTPQGLCEFIANPKKQKRNKNEYRYWHNSH